MQYAYSACKDLRIKWNFLSLKFERINLSVVKIWPLWIRSFWYPSIYLCMCPKKDWANHGPRKPEQHVLLRDGAGAMGEARALFALPCCSPGGLSIRIFTGKTLEILRTKPALSSGLMSCPFGRKKKICHANIRWTSVLYESHGISNFP